MTIVHFFGCSPISSTVGYMGLESSGDNRCDLHIYEGYESAEDLVFNPNTNLQQLQPQTALSLSANRDYVC